MHVWGLATPGGTAPQLALPRSPLPEVQRVHAGVGIAVLRGIAVLARLEAIVAAKVQTLGVPIQVAFDGPNHAKMPTGERGPGQNSLGRRAGPWPIVPIRCRVGAPVQGCQGPHDDPPKLGLSILGVALVEHGKHE
eukprot:6419243-Alexandrium_andersonii.AAC.1